MQNLYQSLTRQAVAKHSKMASRLLNSLKKGIFTTLSSRRQRRKVEKLRRLEKRLNMGAVSQLKHWSMAAALGLITFTAAAQQKGEQYNKRSFTGKDRQLQERRLKSLLPDPGHRAQNSHTSVQVLSFTPGELIGDSPIGSFVHADFDGDGDTDLIKMGYYIQSRVYLNAGNGTYQKGQLLPEELIFPEPAYTGDLDNDGDVDLLVARWDLPHVILLNDGNGQFSIRELSNLRSFSNTALADFDGDGDLDIYVTNPDNQSIRGVLMLNDGSGHFESTGRYDELDQNPVILVSADVNNDNRPDVVMSNVASEVRIMMNKGDGSFYEGVIMPGNHPHVSELHFTDMNGDVYPDLVALTAFRIVVYVNLGGSSFKEVSNLYHNSVVSGLDFTVSFGDMDDDGDTDLVYAPYFRYFYEERVGIFSNNGEGVLSEVQDTGFVIGLSDGEGSPAIDVQTTDANGDGLLDIAYTNFLRWGFLKNEGGGSFRAMEDNLPLSISAGTQTILEDFDGDGYVDLLSTGAPYLWLNEQGSFEPREIAPVMEDLLLKAEASDMDGDGDMDLISTTYDSRKTAVFENDGNAHFTLKQELVIQGEEGYSWQGGVKAGDVDGDGDEDIVAEAFYINLIVENNEQVFINKTGFATWLNNGDGVYSLAGSFEDKGAASDFLLQNVTGDERAELLMTADGYLRVFSVNTAGKLTLVSEYATEVNTDENHLWLNRGDLDADGDVDVLLTDEEGNLTVLANNGSGDFSVLTKLPLGKYSRAATGDLDKDGDMDIISQSYLGGADIWLNEEEGTFVAGGNIATSLAAGHVALADLDKDGDLDLIANSYYTQPQAWYNELPDVPTGLDDIRTAGISLYPNPSGGRFSIDWKQMLPGAAWKLEVLNLGGQPIQQQKVVSGDASELNITALPAGMYLLRLSNGTKSYMHRIVKQ